jgi:hypothetical protein
MKDKRKEEAWIIPIREASTMQNWDNQPAMKEKS